MESKDFQKRTALASALQRHLSEVEGTQATKAKSLGITQPRLSDLMRNRIEKFSIDALVSLTERAGLRLDVSAQKVDLVPTGPMRLARQNTGNMSPFPVEPSELDRLDSVEASKLFLRLLRCDVFSVGLTPKDVLLSLDVTKKDGGIDAKVEKSPQASGLLSLGNTHFQIKTGSAFKPWQPSSLKKELFGDSKAKPSQKLMGSEVRTCLSDNGTYSLVVFGYDLLPDQHTKSVSELVSLFKKAGFENPKVQVLGQGQIAGEIERYPSIYRDLFGFANDALLTVRSWKGQSLMQQQLCVGDRQKELISNIRDSLNENSTGFVRLVGEPGIGKTRLMMEAVSHEELAPTVIYAPTGEEFQESRLFKEIIQTEILFQLTIVVDDCDESDRSSIWAALKGKPGIRLATIDHGLGHSSDSDTCILQCPGLERAQVEAILETYLGKRHDLGDWADLCDGSPRVAHAVGQNLKENPEDILRQPTAVPLWDRFVVGYEAKKSRAADEYRTVLRHIALFTRFGFEHPVSEEGKFIAKLVEEANPLITYSRFQEIVQHFRKRRVLQGSHTLFLVPRALQIHLWLEYWTNYGRDFDFAQFFSRVPSDMRNWFLSMFSYAHEPQPAQAVVQSILAPAGPFSNPALVNSESGPRLLRYLAEADPERTLACIERIYGEMTADDLKTWESGKQDIVRALEYISVWNGLFERSTALLARLALVETSKYSNNSVGTLKGLFSIGNGWAATKAPPEARFPSMRGLITSRDNAQFRLGLDLAESWLSTYGGYRVIGPEHQGLRPTIEFWRPKTYGEIYDSWRLAWRFLLSELRGSESPRSTELARVLISSTEGLIQIEALATEVTDTLFELAEHDDTNRQELTALVIRLLKYRQSSLSEETISRIRDLDTILTGSSLWDRVCRFVLNTNWDEDFEKVGDNVNESVVPTKRTAAIARELMSDTNTLREYAGRLLTADGHRLAQLGLHCGELAVDTEFDEVIFSYVNSPELDTNPQFVCGYVSGVRRIDEQRWEKLILSLLDDDNTRGIGVHAVSYSGYSDDVIRRLIDLYIDEKVNANAFDRYSFRISTSNVSEQNFSTLIDALVDNPIDMSGNVAVALLCEYYVANDPPRKVPHERSLAALIASTKDDHRKSPMAGHYWGQLAKAFLKDYESDKLTLLETVLMASKLNRYDNAEALKILSEIVKAAPHEAWTVIARRLAEEGRECWDIVHWLGNTFGSSRGEPSPARYLPAEAVIEWIHEKPVERVGLILDILPKTFDIDSGGKLTTRFVEEFGSDKKITGNLIGHFWGGSWSGPESLKLEKDRSNARTWLSHTNSQNVRTWLSKYIDSLNTSIVSAKIREEREF